MKPLPVHPETPLNRVMPFLRRRFSPEGALGLHLTLGLVVLIAACWVFGDITEDIQTGDSILQVDQDVATYFHDHASPGRNRIMFMISFFGSVGFLVSATGVTALYLAQRRSWRRLGVLLLVAGGGALVNMGVKLLIHRQRPVFENPIVTLNSFSFPSGHTMGATLFYGLMAAWAVQALRGAVPRLAAILVAVGLVLLVGLSRICLGVHFLSDVLGALAAGVAWLALCLTALEAFYRRR